ncbi:hypothetical protein [Deinococcus humi]|uniref:RecB family endonuclease NucS n=1 Tax=Deinococcus humi TaxID=662880 RepID=A0A7W8JVF1_9DEIO|nr:hypothetical protein [Deinococcus humi]MBB5363655.1 RecB family endonuclease NucS [Deinococcus humi]GGO29899.1 hypothetical protein GCM10008949_24010 [Deinococcus humi]
MIRARLLTPDPGGLTTHLTTHTRTRDGLIQIAGLAEVTYQGRATSTAEIGASLVLLKRGGSLQIHAPIGLKP